MAMIYVNGQKHAVPNGIYCRGCGHSAAKGEYATLFGKQVVIDEYYFCSLFQKRIPECVKLAECIFGGADI